MLAVTFFRCTVLVLATAAVAFGAGVYFAERVKAWIVRRTQPPAKP